MQYSQQCLSCKPEHTLHLLVMLKHAFCEPTTHKYTSVTAGYFKDIQAQVSFMVKKTFSRTESVYLTTNALFVQP